VDSCTWGKNNLVHWYMLEARWLESSFVERDAGVLMDSKLNLNQQCALAAKVVTAFRDALGRGLQVEGLDPPPLLSVGEDTHAVLFPVVDSPVHERHGHMGASPARDHKHDKGTAASVI